MAAADLTLLQRRAARSLLDGGTRPARREGPDDRARTSPNASASPITASPAQGARMVARAWTLIAEYPGADAAPTGRRLPNRPGIAMRGAPPLGVLANEAGASPPCRVHACAAATRVRCSATRRSGSNRPHIAPGPCVIPQGVLAEWNGRSLPAGTAIRVVDSTADYRWMVLPLRPAGTEGWSVDRLAALVSEGDMIGVTVPTAAERAVQPSSAETRWLLALTHTEGFPVMKTVLACSLHLALASGAALRPAHAAHAGAPYAERGQAERRRQRHGRFAGRPAERRAAQQRCRPCPGTTDFTERRQSRGGGKPVGLSNPLAMCGENQTFRWQLCNGR